MKAGAIGLSAALAMASAAGAAPIVDGVLSPGDGHGARKSQVSYNPAAPTSNFQAPTPFTNAIAYDIYLQSDGASYFGLFQAAP